MPGKSSSVIGLYGAAGMTSMSLNTVYLSLGSQGVLPILV